MKTWAKLSPLPRKLSRIPPRMITPLSGQYPALAALPKTIMSGTTSQCSMANAFPVRPKPVMISSAMKSTPYLSQVSRTMP